MYHYSFTYLLYKETIFKNFNHAEIMFYNLIFLNIINRNDELNDLLKINIMNEQMTLMGSIYT